MKSVLIVFSLFIFGNLFSQSSNKIFTSDIDNFWVAYDSIQKTNDYSKKISFINNLYINKGTKGLKAFMEARNYNDSIYIKLIGEYPKFWNSIRQNTLTIKDKTFELNQAIEKFQELYPELKKAEMYFTIGGQRSAGTVLENMVLVGAELATGNLTTDVSEFKNGWFKHLFSKQSSDNIVYLNIHEYVHTQQKTNESSLLLHQTIREGSCDFITELILGKKLETQYISYGNTHSKELKKQFKDEMFSSYFPNWLYNGTDKGETADLGYFIGYEICKSYYNQAKNKKQAIKEIIELNYNDEKEVQQFLKKSKFYKEGFNRQKLMEEYEKKQPYIIKTEPFENGATDVNSLIKDFHIIFSQEMNPKNYSLKYSEKGKDFYPKITKVKFTNNNRAFVLEMELVPNKEYEFIIKNGFTSKNGYPLRGAEYLVKFKTQ